MNRYLLITYYWPPCGGVSVRRWLLFCKYLLRHGFVGTVVTTQDGDYPYVDESLVGLVPDEIKVVRTYTPTFKGVFRYLVGKDARLPYGSLLTSEKDGFFKRLMYFLRTQLVSPDARVVWNLNAFKEAEMQLRSGVYTAVITTGPPHSTHLVGLWLKKKYNHIKWIADLRDPWSKIYYLENMKRNVVLDAYDRYLERRVLSQADVSVTVSDGFVRCFEGKVSRVIPNGFDPDDFADKVYNRGDCFRVKFVGALTDSRKNEVVQTLDWINEYATKVGIKDIEFTLIGAYEKEPEELAKMLSAIRFKNIGFVNHDKVIEECVNAEVLLLVINKTKNNEGILPLKLFEYIGSRTHVLGVGPLNSDVIGVLEETSAGEMFGYDEKEMFLKRFEELYFEWKDGGNIKNEGCIDKYSVMRLCEEYVGVLAH
jgi:glycosyltransferase involved in cell wall biosynthesis